MHKIYISPSLQPKNLYVSSNKNEQEVMHCLGALVVAKLSRHKDIFEVKSNTIGLSLNEAIAESNAFDADIHLALHTNADSNPDTEGTESYYHEGSVKGRLLAELVYRNIAPISPGKDRGIKSDKTIYVNGFAELRETLCPAALIEIIYHTNSREVLDLLARQEAYAEALYRSVCEYFDVEPLDKGEIVFPDILGHFAEEDIVEAKRLGIVTGYPDGLFRPEKPITRAEAVTLLVRMYNKLLSEKE